MNKREATLLPLPQLLHIHANDEQVGGRHLAQGQSKSVKWRIEPRLPNPGGNITQYRWPRSSYLQVFEQLLAGFPAGDLQLVQVSVSLHHAAVLPDVLP